MADYVIVNGQLYHHGIKGQKWGVRRYQNSDGTLTPAGRKHYAKTAAKYDHKAGKTSNANKQAKYKQKAADARKELRKDNLAKGRIAKAEKQKQAKLTEEEKQRVLAEGTATDILKFKGRLSNQEMQNALNRIDLERRLSEISAKEIAAGEKKTKTLLETTTSIMDKVDKVRGATEKGISAYNTIAKINNSLSKEKMPIIDGGESNKKLLEKAKNDKKEKELRSMTKEDVIAKAKDLSNEDLKYIKDRMNSLDSITGKKDGKGKGLNESDVEEMIRKILEEERNK